MANLRTSIREYAVVKLAAAFPSAIVYDARYIPPKVEDALLNPVIDVFTLGDTSELSPEDQTNIRVEKIDVVVFVAGLEEHQEPDSGGSIAVRLDAACNTVGATIGGFRQSFNGLVHKVTYTNTVISIAGQEKSGYLVGSAVMRFNAQYFEELLNF